jgi:transposase InsO family protein
MKREIKARLRWVQLFLATGNATLVCRRCGISRPTLRKWVTRYKHDGIAGLASRSRKPETSPGRKVFEREEAWILELRKRSPGARRIQSELKRLHGCSLSLATIHKILSRHQIKPLKLPRRKKRFKRYSRPIPGDRVQMDTCKIAPGLYQYTAIDDCTRCRVLGLYSRRTAANTLRFLDRVLEEMPFPIQRFQTDRGREFFAIKVQKRFMQYGIKFRPVKPASPHLNGKVERSQKTDLQEFYATVDPSDKDLELKLAEWQHYYNWDRPHSSLRGKTPMDRFFELIKKTPYWDEVHREYDPAKERIQDPNYQIDMRLRRIEELKRSM